MSETPPKISESERRENARVRRRLLNLGELLAIVAVAISALTFWNSYRERTNSEAERHADAARNSKKAAILVLHATPGHDGNMLALAPRADSQSIQSQTIVFPSALGLDPVETTGDARIEKSWFEGELAKARKAAGAGHDEPGDARLPVMITSHFLVDGDPASDRALFEIGYTATRAFLGGTTIHLKGLSRIEGAHDEAAGKRRLDALTAAQLK
jgi:hypothetical protein